MAKSPRIESKSNPEAQREPQQGTFHLSIPVGDSSRFAECTLSSTSSRTVGSNETEVESKGCDESESSVRPKCTATCCAKTDEAFQPISKHMLSQVASKKKNFHPQ